MASNCPISTTRLKQICTDACDSALSTATHYEHSHTESWNNAIINSILKALISESTTDHSHEQQQQQQQQQQIPRPKYKFAVNSTIIQHLSDPRPTGNDGEEKEDGVSLGTDDHKKVGRRGMHSASGAYWNDEKDGMWSFKYEGGEGKGMDIVISIMWIAV